MPSDKIAQKLRDRFWEEFYGLTPGAEPANSGVDREKLEQSVKAAVQLTVFCMEHFEKTGEETKRNDALDFVQANFPKVAEKTFRAIWAEIPSKYRKGQGRPRKT